MNIKKIIQITLSLMVCVFIAKATDQIPAPSQKQPVALINGIIHPVSGPVIKNGAILFNKGKIVELGANINIPSDAVKIDLKGKHVFPGLIESYSSIGLTEIGAVRSTNDFAERGKINSNVCAEVAINPESEYFPVSRANGIALSVSRPSGGIICGKSALLKMDGWTWEDMTLKAPVSMILKWPRMKTNVSRRRPQSQEKPREGNENMDLLIKTFDDAEAYMTARKSANNNDLPYHKYDPRLEALIPVLKGELPLWIEANSLSEIELAVNWAARRQLKMVLVGGKEACAAADLLKEKNIPVIITTVLGMPSSRDANYDERFSLPARLNEAGVKFCIAGSGASNVRNLPYYASKASSYGLPKDEALKAITLYAAEIIGVADRAGSLEIGKDATLIVTTGDPLEIMTQIEKLYIMGSEIDLSNKHENLYKKYQERYNQLKAE